MRRPLFKRIKEAVKNHDDYFKNKYDATGKEGLSALQKCISSMCILAYGVPADAIDKYVCISDSTARQVCIISVGLSLKFLASSTYGHPTKLV